MVRSGSRALGVVPLQSRHILPAARPSRSGPAPTRFFLRPFDDVTRTSPMMQRSVRSRCGSAHRFSQPLSGFLAQSELRGLVSCRCRPWGSPFRALPLAGIACASRRRLLPCSSPPPYLRCDAPDLVLRVSPTPALVTRWPGFPPELDRRFWPLNPRALARPRDPSRRDARGSRLRTLSRAGLRGLLDDLDLTRRSHLVPAASSASKLCSPRESVRTVPRFRRHTAAGALLGFAPPEP
jgi:hypothetical protein